MASEPRSSAHEPVLVAEATALLRPKAGGTYVDCTVGLGGHAWALLEAGAGLVIGIDRDEMALAHARDRPVSTGRIEFVHADYRELPRVLRARGLDQVDGVLADLGVSSLQLDDPDRGFSFKSDGPLDMRMDRSAGPTAADLLATVDEATLADVIHHFGEERHARRIARAIVQARDRQPIRFTGELAVIVRRAARARGWQRIDPATRTFQALRIWVNRELDDLEGFLEDAAAALRTGGRLVVVAFHSLEDRVVKHTFRRLADDRPLSDGRAADRDPLRSWRANALGIAWERREKRSEIVGRFAVLTRKPITPTPKETERNPRSRSARLRALEKLA